MGNSFFPKSMGFGTTYAFVKARKLLGGGKRLRPQNHLKDSGMRFQGSGFRV